MATARQKSTIIFYIGLLIGEKKGDPNACIPLPKKKISINKSIVGVSIHYVTQMHGENKVNAPSFGLESPFMNQKTPPHRSNLKAYVGLYFR